MDSTISREIDVASRARLVLAHEKENLSQRAANAPSKHPATFSAKQNNIGFIRLLAASLVIVSHSPEMIDGNRLREPLTRLFGTLSFGDLGVDMFFLISGYLITKSYLSSGRGHYLIKRVARIYPGYLVAYLVCIFLVAPLAGITLSSLGFFDYAKIVYHALWLDMPQLKGVFATEHYHFLNGAMWTISYEFRCYLFVMLAGALGVYKKRIPPLMLPVVLLSLHFFITSDFSPSSQPFSAIKELLIGDPVQLVRFMFVFTCGASFYLFRDKIKYTGSAAFICVLCLLVAMFSDKLAEPALCTFGAYSLFYFAFKAAHININNHYDFSYGVYLYAWPIAALAILHHPTLTVVSLSCFTLILALCAGAVSWFVVERPVTDLLRRLPKQAAFFRKSSPARTVDVCAS